MTALIGGPGSSHLRTADQGFGPPPPEESVGRKFCLFSMPPPRARRLERERGALGAELERASGLGHRSRPLGASTVERAGKAVTARIRDAIRLIEAVIPSSVRA